MSFSSITSSISWQIPRGAGITPPPLGLSLGCLPVECPHNTSTGRCLEVSLIIYLYNLNCDLFLVKEQLHCQSRTAVLGSGGKFSPFRLHVPKLHEKFRICSSEGEDLPDRDYMMMCPVHPHYMFSFNTSILQIPPPSV